MTYKQYLDFLKKEKDSYELSALNNENSFSKFNMGVSLGLELALRAAKGIDFTKKDESE